ncbi:M23 family peptidase [Polaribacter sp. WD7]|uniref:M23 family metallopeptidase n=1 Tax=Polaribacter sp. WD7 TaxID=2269061 RepID=UPI000DF181DE|nr:M23 family metallopeptidase [Polaribacter sp. WD7]RCS27080.1 M23 family peptidase [Polaribacter sp. WD7]
MKRLFFISILFLALKGYCQKKYPKNYFTNPLDIPTVLSGTFGELRSNHFHSGVDIKTQRKEGLKIYAPADGYVSRIKVAQFGFGKALYITHPNGYTTVYAHLKKFAPKIEEYVKFIQYKKENYATGNLFFKEDKFPVNKGDIIGFTGDTGSSGAPHLHYEVRDSKTANIINPLFFGINPIDSKPPVLESIKAYTLTKNSRIDNKNKNFILPIKKIAEGKYSANRIFAAGSIGFAINTFDRLDLAPNKNGIYSLEMLVNGKRYFYHNVETFSFSETKFINLHIDYQHYKKYRKKYQKLFRVKPNKLSTYKEITNDGKIDIQNGLSYSVEIIAKDYAGNKSSVKIPITGKESNSLFQKQKDTTEYKIIAKKFHRFSKDGISIAFPKNTFYEDVYLDFKVENGIAKVHQPTIPLNKSFTLTFDVSKFSESEKQQLYIANLEYSKYPRYQNTRKKDSTFYTTSKTLGNYGLLKDSIKPTIKTLYFKDNQWISKFTTLKVKINDIGSGIKNWRATIDGEWVLMQYNHKKGILTYNFSDKKLVGSKHIFKIVVSDNVGNTNMLSTTFFKKQVN